jgi:hypothetical protein
MRKTDKLNKLKMVSKLCESRYFENRGFSADNYNDMERDYYNKMDVSVQEPISPKDVDGDRINFIRNSILDNNRELIGFIRPESIEWDESVEGLSVRFGLLIPKKREPFRGMSVEDMDEYLNGYGGSGYNGHSNTYSKLSFVVKDFGPKFLVHVNYRQGMDV